MLERSLLFVLLTFAPALTTLAGRIEHVYTISPDRGPVTGGTTVTLRGSFPAHAYGVFFGEREFVNATRVNSTTLTAVTPANLPGTVAVSLFEIDIELETNVTFTFEGDADTAFVPLLLPVYSPPVRGAFGSEFHTSFRAALKGTEEVHIFGLTQLCRLPPRCGIQPPLASVLLAEQPEIHTDNPDLRLTGRPGAFLYIPKEHAGRLAMNLRVFDVSRAAENFGTELPIVRGEEFTEGFDESITLTGIPSDPRFRNTLRIYARGEAGALVTVDVAGDTGFHATHRVPVDGGTLFTPGYVQFSDFPVNQGTLTVTIRHVVPPISALIPPSDLWALVSVTNNDTQHFTTITPQP